MSIIDVMKQFAAAENKAMRKNIEKNLTLDNYNMAAKVKNTGGRPVGSRNKPRPFHELGLAQARKVLAAAIEVSGISEKEFMESREHEPFMARSMTMWIMRTDIGLSYAKIGYLFQRDHSSMIHGFKRIDAMMNDDPELQTICNEIRKAAADDETN